MCVTHLERERELMSHYTWVVDAASVPAFARRFNVRRQRGGGRRHTAVSKPVVVAAAAPL